MIERPRTSSTHPVPGSAGARALRRDTDRFLRALGSYDPAQHQVAVGLAAWFDAATSTLRHAGSEDLEAAVVGGAGALRRLADAPPDEREVARRAAEDAVVRVRALLLERFDASDGSTLPSPWAAHDGPRVPVPRWGGHGGSAFGLCWCLEAATAAERLATWRALPITVRLRYRLIWRRRYQRLAAVLGVDA